MSCSSFILVKISNLSPSHFSYFSSAARIKSAASIHNHQILEHKSLQLISSQLPQILRDFSITDMDKLQWGNRKRLRCMKVKDSSLNGKSDGGGGGGGVLKKVTSRVVENNNGHVLPPAPSPHRPHRELGVSRSSANDIRKASTSLSPEKEDRYYTTRGSGAFDDNNSKALFCNPKEENKKIVWPKLLIALSSKEKEEDFMAMKGCKPPQRPKKRAKLIQRTVVLVSPGAWLTDLCQERYEVREKKTSKKKPRGLKAMGSMESDSE